MKIKGIMAVTECETCEGKGRKETEGAFDCACKGCLGQGERHTYLSLKELQQALTATLVRGC